METRVNKDTTTHLEIFDYSETDYIWCNEKPIKFLWIFNDGKFEKGYWRRGEQSNWNWMMGEDYLNHYVDREGILFERPLIKIYAGEYLIQRKYFDTIEDAQRYCKGKFPNVNIIFKD